MEQDSDINPGPLTCTHTDTHMHTAWKMEEGGGGRKRKEEEGQEGQRKEGRKKKTKGNGILTTGLKVPFGVVSKTDSIQSKTEDTNFKAFLGIVFIPER